jgi:hypothetical protein
MLRHAASSFLSIGTLASPTALRGKLTPPDGWTERRTSVSMPAPGHAASGRGRCRDHLVDLGRSNRNGPPDSRGSPSTGASRTNTEQPSPQPRPGR